MCVGPSVFKRLCVHQGVPWWPPSPLALTFFMPPVLQGSLSPEERHLMEECHLVLSIPRSLTLCTVSTCESQNLFPSTTGAGFSDEG